MLLIITSSLVYTELKKNAIKALSEEVKKLWDKWEVRGLILFSLFLQIVLVGLGDRLRSKGSARRLVTVIVWLTYLLADWVATVSLSSLLRSERERFTAMAAFWAPFLLLHLGGPDTITAYALEDNELWMRHLFGLCIQVAVALYVYYSFQGTSVLRYLAILIFVAGMIKYGERTWSLRIASSTILKQSISSGKHKNDHRAEANRSKDLDFYSYLSHMHIIRRDARALHAAFKLLQLFKQLFLNLVFKLAISFVGDARVFDTVSELSTLEALKVVDIELGFLYDMLYTKRPLLNTGYGVILRTISFLSSCSALVAFWFFIGFDIKNGYSMGDIGISYCLLLGAVALEIYSIIEHCRSNWTMLWASKHDNCLASFIYWANTSWLARNEDPELPLAQYNFLNCCVESKLGGIVELLEADNVLREYCYTTWKPIDIDLKCAIYSHLLQRVAIYKRKDYEFETLAQMLNERGGGVLHQTNIYDQFSWSIGMRLSESLLHWHVATDMCYRVDGNKYGVELLGPFYRMSKVLSDYMLHILIMQSTLLPNKGIDEVRFARIWKETKKKIVRKKGFDITGEISKFLNGQSIPMGGESSTLLSEAGLLAKDLQGLVTEDRWDIKDKWEMISKVWIEMLTHVAGQCNWKNHLKQLGCGGELLTHVALLMAHLGLTPNIRVMPVTNLMEMASAAKPWDWDTCDLTDFLA